MEALHKKVDKWGQEKKPGYGCWAITSIRGTILDGADAEVTTFTVTRSGWDKLSGLDYGNVDNCTIPFSELQLAHMLTIPDAWVAFNAKRFSQIKINQKPTIAQRKHDFEQMYKLGFELYLDGKHVFTSKEMPELNADHVKIGANGIEENPVSFSKKDGIITADSRAEFGLIMVDKAGDVIRVKDGKHEIPLFVYGLQKDKKRVIREFERRKQLHELEQAQAQEL